MKEYLPHTSLIMFQISRACTFEKRYLSTIEKIVVLNSVNCGTSISCKICLSVLRESSKNLLRIF